MKNILTHILSGAVGAFVIFFVFKSQMTHQEAQVAPAPLMHKVNESINVPVAGTSFVDAAKKATGAVVHIRAEESEAHMQQRLEEQRKKRRGQSHWFFDDFWEDNFFGGNHFRQQKGSGSGVIFTSNGYIITNNHVVGFADVITVTTSDGKKYKAQKIGTDPSTDLAVIKIEANDLKTMDLADSDMLEVGEWVLAVGNPFDYLTSTVTAGIVSAKGRELDIIEADKSIEEFIQTDAAINPGNSGGALVTSDGKLVGINTAIATPTGVFAGYSFAIPSNLMNKIVKDIIKTGGDIHRVTLGVGGYDINESLKKEYDLKVSRGFYVENVEPQSSANMGGVLPGDIILGIDNKDITNFSDIEQILKFAKSGDKMNITISRNGKVMTIPIYLRRISQG